MMNKKPFILIGDPSKELFQTILSFPSSDRYLFELITAGDELLKKIATSPPDLIIVDLMLPEMHGIEILKKIRGAPSTKDLGVIITSSNPMIQNYHAAVKEGANYFLEKPFQVETLLHLIDQFFSSGLTPIEFKEKRNGEEKTYPFYLPKSKPLSNYLKFWGTRGSNPVSGPEYLRFGGNTACLEVRSGNDMIIIDAGTGIRPLGNALNPSQNKNITLILSHTHWDHITGFPFFNPLYHPDCKVTIWSPVGFEKSTQELFTEMLAYAYFPVRLDDIKANLIFKDLRDKHPISVGNITIESHYAFHPGATLCFKIHVAGKIFGYATDNEMFLGYMGDPNALGKDHPLILSNESMIQFFKNCDYFIHEAQYTPLEYQKRIGWGHSSIFNAAILAKYCSVKEWIVTHHDPKHTDEELLTKYQLHKEILQECHISCNVEMAFDGMILPI